MAQADVLNLRERRIRAAAVFLFLSGIHAEAFTTLTLETVDIRACTVLQWLQKGVRTKNQKHGTTYLLPIPDLMKVVSEWDSFLRLHLPPTGLRFAPLEPTTGELDLTASEVGKHRHVRLRRDLKRWLDRVGLQYRSPHKFRHGHAVYSLTHAKDVADLKAISLNLMHSNLSITDGIYAILSDEKVQDRIKALSERRNKNISDRDIADALRALADDIEKLGKR